MVQSLGAAPAHTKVCPYTVPTEIVFSIEIQIALL
jgi:hypothetical protein